MTLANVGGLEALRAFVLGVLATGVLLVVTVTLKVGREIRELEPPERGSAIVPFLFMILNLLMISIPVMLLGGLVGVAIAYVAEWVGG